LGTPLAQLLKRPEVSIGQLLPALVGTGDWQLTTDHWEMKSVETELKYAGYLDQQARAIERLKKAEQRAIPDWFDYALVSGLSREMKEKLLRVRPRTLAQASRIPGVTPAAVSLVHVFIEIQARRHAAAATLSS
ncbi:MAG: tRNA uridine-5-carboxymethylaminomethyl(34) synthesis enzyme MnmG, partial [Acidobacteriota bacterium]|nr:tRNA uridine-5-carboxymethylaminomethyl(34) synthesis enzyme MnmG [Acidobacteriota bacterium]